MTATDTKKELDVKPKIKSLQQIIEDSARELGRALPEHMRPERLVRIALTCLRVNPKLAQCTPMSFLGALFTAAQLGLEPVAGRAHLIPFYNSRKKPDGTWHKVMECQFVIGYPGLVELFYRHEKSVVLDWGTVREKDDFDYELGTNSYLKHIPNKGDRGSMVGHYVIARLANGGSVFRYMSTLECLEHGKQHSKTWDKKSSKFYDDSPWATNSESMCLKTVLIQLAKVLPKSIEMQSAITADETSREFKSGVRDVLSEPSTTDWLDTPAVEHADQAQQILPNKGDAQDD